MEAEIFFVGNRVCYPNTWVFIDLCLWAGCDACFSIYVWLWLATIHGWSSFQIY